MSRASDEWGTPDEVFLPLDAEFHFGLDAAASFDSHKCHTYLTKESNALACDWRSISQSVFLNPPYSQLRAFVQKAHEESMKGCKVVCLLPSRTDTKRVWHRFIWDGTSHHPRTGVQVRFLEGRITFVGAKNGAPFPSAIVVFRPTSVGS